MSEKKVERISTKNNMQVFIRIAHTNMVFMKKATKRTVIYLNHQFSENKTFQ